VLKINSNIESTTSDIKQNCSSIKDFKKQIREINDGLSFSEISPQTKFISKTLFEVNHLKIRLLWTKIHGK
jgi:hypothetical protein